MDYGRLFSTQLPLLLPELFLRLVLSLLLRWGSIVGTDGRRGYPQLRHSRRWLATATVFLTGVLVAGGPSDPKAILSGRLVIDPLSQGAKLLLCVITVGTLLSSRDYAKRVRRNAFEYPLLRLFALLGRRFLISANDLLIFYLALERQSLCLYVLAAFRRGSAFSTEAGLKYFVLGAFASGLFLFGVSILYGFTGATSYEELGTLLVWGDPQGPALIGFALVVSGILFKLSAAPFHRWAPDVLEGSPWSSARFFAAVTKIAAVVGLVRLCYGPFHGLRPQRQTRLRGVAALSRVIGSLAALRQRRLKRFLAYSTVSHRGYLLRGLSTGTLEGLEGVILYTVIYAFRSLTVWTAIGSLRHTAPTLPRDGGDGANVGSRGALYITDLAGLGETNPALARTIAASRFSRAGIPPRAGFVAKFSVFFAAREASFYGTAVVGVLTAVIGAFYYLRWIKIRYFEGVPRPRFHLPVSREASVVRGLGLLPRTLLRVYPTPLLLAAHRAALLLVFPA